MPELVQNCIASWHRVMPDWEYKLWNEDNVDITSAPLYVRQAYEERKFAFVSDYVRLWALEQFGGVYLDTDVEVLRSYEPLLSDTAFMGFEESRAHLPGTCVMGCEAGCSWVKDMLATYDGAEFIGPNGQLDMTTNVERLGRMMVAAWLVPDGKEQYIEKWGLRVYDHHYFSPITSTRVMRKSKDTYSIHHFAASWRDQKGLLPKLQASPVAREVINALVQVKRRIIGICRVK